MDREARGLRVAGVSVRVKLILAPSMFKLYTRAVSLYVCMCVCVCIHTCCSLHSDACKHVCVCVCVGGGPTQDAARARGDVC